MRINVLLFASWSEALGPELAVDLPEGACVGDLLRILAERSVGSVLPRPLVAVNHRYAAPEVVIQASDEVAVIPPVAGG